MNKGVFFIHMSQTSMQMFMELYEETRRLVDSSDIKRGDAKQLSDMFGRVADQYYRVMLIGEPNARGGPGGVARNHSGHYTTLFAHWEKYRDTSFGETIVQYGLRMKAFGEKADEEFGLDEKMRKLEEEH